MHTFAPRVAAMNRRLAFAPLAAVLGLVLGLSACATEPTPTPAAPSEPMSEAPSAPASHAPSPTSRPSSAAEPAAPSPSDAPTDPLLAVELTDVRSGAAFTLSDLAAEEGPILLQPMAIWCSSCRAQQHEVARAHDEGEFSSVSLDVDLSEEPADLAAYADREGWDWRFAMADASLYRLLQERFTPAVTNPPSTPLIVIERDGTVRPLEFGAGVRSAEQLLDELGVG